MFRNLILTGILIFMGCSEKKNENPLNNQNLKVQKVVKPTKMIPQKNPKIIVKNANKKNPPPKIIKKKTIQKPPLPDYKFSKKSLKIWHKYNNLTLNDQNNIRLEINLSFPSQFKKLRKDLMSIKSKKDRFNLAIRIVSLAGLSATGLDCIRRAHAIHARVFFLTTLTPDFMKAKWVHYCQNKPNQPVTKNFITLFLNGGKLDYKNFQHRYLETYGLDPQYIKGKFQNVKLISLNKVDFKNIKTGDNYLWKFPPKSDFVGHIGIFLSSNHVHGIGQVYMAVEGFAAGDKKTYLLFYVQDSKKAGIKFNVTKYFDIKLNNKDLIQTTSSFPDYPGKFAHSRMKEYLKF
jgi:hypothetical protein